MKNERSNVPVNLKKLDTEVQINEEQWSSKHFVYKNHLRASKRGSEYQKLINPLTERAYHRLVQKVKEMHQILTIEDDRLCIEIDFKKHPIHSESMHCIQTKYVYITLECTIGGDYRIQYLLYNCSFEEEIITLIEKLALKHCSTRIYKPDYRSFFKRCLQVQPNRFISIL